MSIRAMLGSKAGVALAGMFLAGLFAGLALARWNALGPDRGTAAAGLTASLSELDLGPDQRARIEQILAASQPRTDRALEEALPRVQAVVDSVDSEIREVLTDDQEIRLEEIRRNVIVERRVID